MLGKYRVYSSRYTVVSKAKRQNNATYPREATRPQKEPNTQSHASRPPSGYVFPYGSVDCRLVFARLLGTWLSVDAELDDDDRRGCAVDRVDPCVFGRSRSQLYDVKGAAATEIGAVFCRDPGRGR